MSHFNRGLLPRLAAMTLALGGATTALAQNIEKVDAGQDQRAPVSLPAPIVKPGHRSMIVKPGHRSTFTTDKADSSNIMRPGL